VLADAAGEDEIAPALGLVGSPQATASVSRSSTFPVTVLDEGRPTRDALDVASTREARRSRCAGL